MAGKASGYGQHIGWSVQQTTDGGYLVGRVATSDCDFGGYNVYLAKTDAQGREVWSRSLGGQIGPPQWFRTHSAIQTSDGGYAVAGIARSLTTDFSGYFFKLAPERLVAGIPVAPEIVAVTRAFARAVLLTWRDTSDNETKFVIERQVNGEEWEVLAEVAANITTYRDVNAPVGIMCYRVSAASAAGRSVPTVPVTVSPPPDAPSALMVERTLRQAFRLIWVDNSSDESKFIMQRKVSLCDWQPLADVPTNTRTYTDSQLPWSDQIAYRVAAANDDGSSPWVESAVVGHPAIPRWQLKIYRPGIDQWIDLRPCSPFFDPNHGTAVIVHGFNPDRDTLLARWTTDVARAISVTERVPENEKVNVLAWEWLREAEGGVGGFVTRRVEAFSHVQDQARLFAKSCREILPSTYSKPIHFMGHSHGAFLVASAGIHLVFADRQDAPTFKVKHVTLWDPPTLVFPANDLETTVKLLRDQNIGAYVDVFAGSTEQGHLNANVWIDVPGTNVLRGGQGHDVFNWYLTTIPAGTDPRLFTPQEAPYPGDNPTIGFGTSELHKENAQRPDDGCQPGLGTLMFNHPVGWRNRPRDFRLRGYQCVLLQQPTQQQTQPLDGSFSGNCDPFSCVNQSPTRIALGLATGGQGAGGAQLVASYTLDLIIDLAWDYLSFQYDFTAVPAEASLVFNLTVDGETTPVWRISSGATLSEDFLDSGLFNIAALQGKSITLHFDLASTEPGTQVIIQNLTFWQSPTHDNRAPVADAGADQAVTVDPDGFTRVILDGSGSTDDAGDQLTYWWMLDNELLGEGITVSVELTSGVHSILLVVRDPADAVGTDTVTTVVNHRFLRGDSNTDGIVDVSDAVKALLVLFADARLTCPDAADANDDGTVNITDPIAILGYLFKTANPPPSPFPDFGPDPTGDGLNCTGG